MPRRRRGGLDVQRVDLTDARSTPAGGVDRSCTPPGWWLRRAATMVSVSGDSDDDSARSPSDHPALQRDRGEEFGRGRCPRYAVRQLARCSEAIASTSDGEAALIAIRAGEVRTGKILRSRYSPGPWGLQPSPGPGASTAAAPKRGLAVHAGGQVAGEPSPARR